MQGYDNEDIRTMVVDYAKALGRNAPNKLKRLLKQATGTVSISSPTPSSTSWDSTANSLLDLLAPVNDRRKDVSNYPV